jgi:hypothetical protein
VSDQTPTTSSGFTHRASRLRKTGIEERRKLADAYNSWLLGKSP